MSICLLQAINCSKVKDEVCEYEFVPSQRIRCRMANATNSLRTARTA